MSSRVQTYASDCLCTRTTTSRHTRPRSHISTAEQTCRGQYVRMLSSYQSCDDSVVPARKRQIQRRGTRLCSRHAHNHG